MDPTTELYLQSKFILNITSDILETIIFNVTYTGLIHIAGNVN